MGRLWGELIPYAAGLLAFVAFLGWLEFGDVPDLSASLSRAVGTPAVDTDGEEVDRPASPGGRLSRTARIVADVCADVGHNEVRIVALPWHQSRTRVGATYAIQRPRRNVYEILLNISFAAASDYDGRAPRARVDREYRDYANRCLAQFGDRLRDTDGRRLVLKLVDPDDAGDLAGVGIPEAPLVEVGRSGMRSFSRKWASDADCPTVLHELLHVIGLVDEYSPVAGQRRKDEHDCRVTGPPSSVMRSHWAMKEHARVLWPGHINAVLYPGCEARNARYYACSIAAYEGSRRLTGCPDWPFRMRRICTATCDDRDCPWLE